MIKLITPHRLRLLATIAAGLAPATLAGCVDDTKATVTGKVTYHNAPVTGGNLLLYAEGNASPFPVYIRADGAFNVSGAPSGPMRVAIETDSVPPAEATLPPEPPGGVPVPPNGKGPETGKIDLSNMPKKVPIPPKYKDPNSSGLTWEIKPGKNSRDFPLTDD